MAGHSEATAAFNAIRWIEDHFDVEPSDSASFTYATQETLSFRHMPGIYKPWEAENPIHFRLRGRVLDFASVMAGGRVLDFGPGEGFPSLPLAEFVREVVGVEGSLRRVEECAGNARRLGIANASFVHVPPGDALPFPNGSFDGAVASWSLEQSPDLAGTLREVCRVLRPGGVFRFEPETLGRYANGEEQQVWLPDAMGGIHGLTIFDRDLAAELVRHYGLLVETSGDDGGMQVLKGITEKHGCMPGLSALSQEDMEALKPHVRRAGKWTTRHPSFASWPACLREAGFAETHVTYSGGWMAERALALLPQEQRPRSLEQMDALLGPMARIAATMEAPVTPATEAFLFVTACRAGA